MAFFKKESMTCTVDGYKGSESGVPNEILLAERAMRTSSEQHQTPSRTGLERTHLERPQGPRREYLQFLHGQGQGPQNATSRP